LPDDLPSEAEKENHGITFLSPRDADWRVGLSFPWRRDLCVHNGEFKMSPLKIAAARLAEEVPKTDLHPGVLDWLEKAKLASEDQGPWCVAFSGGADSLLLLLLVWAHWPEHSDALAALHFNHCLRGEESDADEAFCRGICEELGVRFRTARWTEAVPDASEAEARDARRIFFETEMTVAGARILWTGHQKNDIVETQLMRLARGSGAAGLSAPRPVQKRGTRTTLRPLLTLEKTEICAHLQAVKLSWREDASNEKPVYLRNRIRSSVTPLWQEVAGRDVLEGAALSRERLEEDDLALETWLAELGVKTEADTIDLRPLHGKPRALWRRALRRWPPAAGLERSGFESLLLLCEQGEEAHLSLGTGTAVIRGGSVHFRDSLGAERMPWTESRLWDGILLFLPSGGRVRASRLTVSPDLRARVLSGEVDPAVEAVVANHEEEFTVRSWLPGDRYRPLGAPGSAKVQDLFVNRKIPVSHRTSLPLICARHGGIIWIPGFSPAEHSKITDKTVTAVQLTYEPGNSNVRD